MPIQFYCISCGKAIEVDDEFAGRTAQCPYCSEVIAVPPTSTLRQATPQAAPVAGTAGPAQPPPVPGQSTELEGFEATPGARPPNWRERRARRLGWIAFVVWGLAIIAAIIQTTYVRTQYPDAFKQFDENPPKSLAEMTQAVEEMQSQLAEATKDDWFLPAMEVSRAILFLGALVVALLSIGTTASNNRIGIVAVIVTSITCICCCGGPGLALLTG